MHDYITAICTAANCLSGTSNQFDVLADSPASLNLTPDSDTVKAGDILSLTVTIYDNYGNIATGYTGTVQFESSDNRAILPADYTFTSADSGTHTFVSDIVLKTTGNQTITSTDILDAGLTDISNWTVNAGSTAHFIFLPIDRHQTAGTPFSVTILAVDEYGNQTDFNGDASITDQTGTFLADINVVGGMATFDVTITAAYLGDYLSATSNSLRGTSNNFDINTGAPYSLILTPDTQGQLINNKAYVTATLYDQYGNPVPYANIFWQISGIGTFTDTGTSSNSTTGDADARSTISVESAVTGISHITASSGTVWGTAMIIWEETFPLTTTSITTSTATSSTTSIITTSPISTITGTTTITTTTSNPATTTSPIITTTITFPTTFSTSPLTTFTLTPTSSGTTIVTSTADNNDDIYSFLWIWGSALAGLLIIGLLIIYWRSGIYGVILCSPYQSIMKDSTVILKNSYGKIVDRFTTGPDGKYHFKHIKSGIYELNVTHSGCRTGEHSIARVHVKTLGRTNQNLEVYPLKNNNS
jgi:adhesin/invasin